ncbi:MAG: aldose 1-epimerase family protein [Nocardioides sp.]
MTAPSGEQYEISGGGYRAVVTEAGATLRVLEYDGAPLLRGFAEDAKASGGAGQLLLPWPNRVADGRYTFDGESHQLPLSEPARHHASHGLTRWVSWTLEEMTPHSVSLVYRLMAQPGYPWTLDLHALFDVSADGLTVTVTATNLADRPAPYASGAHPYLAVGEGPVDGWELTLPASSRLTVDERLIPTGEEPVGGTESDFRVARPIRGTVFDTAFGDLARDARGIAEVRLHDPVGGRGSVLWLDGAHRWLQVYSADATEHPRQALAVEPMTAPPDAFNSGRDLVVLAPAGSDGDEHSASWGIRSL